jgi:hypothetical protein
MINKHLRKHREGHPAHNASAFGLSVMSTVLVIQWVVGDVLWHLVFLLARYVLHISICTGPFIYVYSLRDYKCSQAVIDVNFFSVYKCDVFYMRLIACMFATFYQIVINVCKVD